VCVHMHAPAKPLKANERGRLPVYTTHRIAYLFCASHPIRGESSCAQLSRALAQYAAPFRSSTSCIYSIPPAVALWPCGVSRRLVATSARRAFALFADGTNIAQDPVQRALAKGSLYRAFGLAPPARRCGLVRRTATKGLRCRILSCVHAGGGAQPDRPRRTR
jgi:hypothetical protein